MKVYFKNTRTKNPEKHFFSSLNYVPCYSLRGVCQQKTFIHSLRGHSQTRGDITLLFLSVHLTWTQQHQPCWMRLVTSSDVELNETSIQKCKSKRVMIVLDFFFCFGHTLLVVKSIVFFLTYLFLRRKDKVLFILNLFIEYVFTTVYQEVGFVFKLFVEKIIHILPILVMGIFVFLILKFYRGRVINLILNRDDI